MSTWMIFRTIVQRYELTACLRQRLWCLGKLSTTSCRTSSVSEGAKAVRFCGRLPPNIRAMLNSERLLQTRHVSCGLSLTTSHSAHNTAFCRAIAVRHRPLSGASSTYEAFITEPRKTSLTIFNSFQEESFPPRWCYLDNFLTLQWLRRHTVSIGGALLLSC